MSPAALHAAGLHWAVEGGTISSDFLNVLIVRDQSPNPMEIHECHPAEDILCQAFSNVLLESEDPDMDDSNDPNLCRNYVKDIYNYLRHLEIGRHLRTFAVN